MAKETTLKEVGEMLTHVVEHMATKVDIAHLDTRLGTKLTKFEKSKIDKRKQLEVRVAAIEKHLGIDKKIAA
jgi:hypothetical protein